MNGMYKYALILVLFLILNAVDGQRIIKGPIDRFTYESKSIQLDCLIQDYSPDTDLIQWCKNSFCTWGRTIETDNGNGEDKRLQYKSLPRYFVTGNRASGEWNLYIENVTQADEGEYMCVVIRQSDDTSKTVKYESNVALLKLMRTPREVTLDKQSEFPMTVGHIESIECRIRDAVPAPLIHWQLSDGTQLTQYSNIKQSVEKTGNTNTSIYTFTSRLDLVSTLDYENKTISCIVEHPTLDKPVIESVKIDLNYAPILTIANEPNENLIEGRSYRFVCNVESKEAIVSKRFYVDGSDARLESSDGKELRIVADRKLHGKMLVCEYENRIGVSRLNQTFDIYYPPKFTVTPQALIITNNTETVELDCDVDSNPRSSVVWLKNKNDLIEISTKLTLTNLYQSAEYTCKATNYYFETTITTNTVVIVQGLPTFVGNQVHAAEAGSSLNVEFQILSSPSFEDEPVCEKFQNVAGMDDLSTSQLDSVTLNKIALNRPKFSLEQINNDKSRLASRYILRINKIVSVDDFGVYSCSVRNSYGKTDFVFEVKKRADNKSLFLMALAVVLSVLFVLIVILFISVIVCRRRLRQHTANGNQKKKNNALPNVMDDLASHHSGASPNISVSETWTTTTNTKTSSLNDDQSSDKSSSSHRNLLTNHDSNGNIAIVLPHSQLHIDSYYNYQHMSHHNVHHSPEVFGNYRNSQLLNHFDIYDTYNTKPSLSSDIYVSKFQTNV